MKRSVRITLRILGILLLLLAVVALGGWIYVKSEFLDFENDFTEKRSFPELNSEGFTFTDRNGNGTLDAYEDSRLPVDARVEDVLARMTTEEKIHLLKGSGLASAMGSVDPGEGIPGAVGTIVPTPRLGLPALYLSDGPAGLRIEPTREGEERSYYCTAFPIATLLASTWNADLVEAVGAAMGDEAKAYGIDVILGPGANIHRHPFCGRNFEYYSEDPVLSGDMGAAMVNGIEASGVGTSVKHFVANNQETNRKYNDVRISERALREIYLKGFEIIVKKAQPATIMSSYNMVNGTYTAESRKLLTGVLRDEWQFEGLVMSDWFGGEDAPAMIKAGNDLLEPGTKKQWDALKDAYNDGSLSEGDIDTAVRRILKLIITSGKMENYAYDNNPDLEAHAEITRLSASEGMVLLRNKKTLPLPPALNVALLGVTSYDFIAGGTGSGDVNEAYTVSLEEGLINAGYTINREARDMYEALKKTQPEAFVKPEGIDAMFTPYQPPQLTYTFAQLNKLAATSDVAVITIGRNAGEGGDRVEVDDFLLTAEEQEMIRNTCEVFHRQGKRVIVVLNIGGVIETASWKSLPDAILLAWQGGQEGGNAVADILSGKTTPSGKLPVTFPVAVSDHASHSNFPLDGEPMSLTDLIFSGPAKKSAEVRNHDFTDYEEGIYVGYRHFDKKGLEVSYPFGYGLSYTTFSYGVPEISLANDTVRVTLEVKNSGKFPGKEVFQVYVSKPDSMVDRPEKELKAFEKTALLEPGQEAVISMKIPVSDLAYWDEKASRWVVEEGRYEIRIGTSSRDIKTTTEISL
ncbi:beta-glucosidase family protein [Robertkochia flava]|uniref:beta-glucosidase family protein n=1 Tax=Robertkochia flava TaxID=3447986 RepID=UPI001CCA6E86|nr:glycoside hydrolase family 3 N-terminal domain-containing protein [Robertkochia marina]